MSVARRRASSTSSFSSYDPISPTACVPMTYTPLKPVPSPYLISPLNIGPLVSSSLSDNEAAYHRHYFFREINAAAHADRDLLYYEEGGYGWVPIYFNKEWAAYLKALDEDSDDEEMDEAAIRAQVKLDAQELIPDTDLEPPAQELFKSMYGTYVIDEEVRRRVENRVLQAADKRAGNTSVPKVQRWRETQPQPKAKKTMSPEQVYEQMFEQLTSFAEMEVEMEQQHKARRNKADETLVAFREVCKNARKESKRGEHAEHSQRSRQSEHSKQLRPASTRVTGAEGKKTKSKAKRLSLWIKNF